MKKVLVISGSPRKNGNTIQIVRKIEESIKEKNNDIEFWYLYLKDKNLKYCIGCMDCIRKRGAAACPIKDDSLYIHKKMHEADALIFASPGYAHSVTALYKNFMDRFMFLDHLPEFVGVPSVIVATAGGDGVNEVTKYMINMGVDWWGCNIVAKLGVNAFPYFKNEKYKNSIEKKIKKIAQKLNEELYSVKLKHPPLNQYILFHYNKMETAMDDTGVPGRYNLWKQNGWLNSDYYYPVKIKLSYRIFRFLLMGFFNIMIKATWGKEFKKTISDFQIHEKEGKYSTKNLSEQPIYI
ncbi:MAG: flavodoxin family protein [Chitinispirillia bacterium]|jgi:multimeric flavodoxin WrbA